MPVLGGSQLVRYQKTNPSKVYTEWTRPSDWLSIPSISTGEQVIYLLYGVLDNDSNYVALLCQGNYTVDWGNGVVENFTSNTKAQYAYTFSSIPSNTTTSEGYRQVLIKVTPQAGQNLTVVNLQQRHSFYTSANITTILDMVLNIPNVTASNLTIGANSPTVVHARCKRVWINQIGVLTSTSFLFGNLRDLENIPLFDTSGVTNFSNMFTNCFSLQIIPLFNTPSGTSFANMFQNCLSLLTIPLLNTGNATNMGSMFSGCSSLQVVPLLNTSKVTSIGSMFSNCFSLQSVPLFDTSNVTSMSSTFQNCFSLQLVPNFNTSKVTTMFRAFQACTSLMSAPTLDTGECTNFSFMYGDCYSLVTVPHFNTSNGTSLGYLFGGCRSLQNIPTLNTSNATDMANIFQNCTSLLSIPNLDYSKTTSINGTFFGCNLIESMDFSAPLATGGSSGNNTFWACGNIKKIKAYTPLMTDAPNFVFGCTNLTDLEIDASSWATNTLNTVSIGMITLTRLILTNMKISFNITSNKLSAKAINELGNSVANRTGFSSPTVTLTGNPGTATMNTSIWTNKNWTVVI
jgi:surface protein